MHICHICIGNQLRLSGTYRDMNRRTSHLFRCASAFGLLLCVALSNAQAAEKPIKLIELFTSQGCSSCPPADELAGRMREADKDLVLIEYHVDYWNSLIHGRDGNFVDPYSKPEYSDRQRLYNRVGLRGRPGVYTPQAVINGRVAAVGSDKRRITKALNYETRSIMSIDIAASDNKSLTIKVTGSEADRALAKGADVWLVSIIDKVQTEITGGENRYKTLTNHHVATDVNRLGRVGTDADLSFRVAKPTGNNGCVVLIQGAELNPVYAAASCP